MPSIAVASSNLTKTVVQAMLKPHLEATHRGILNLRYVTCHMGASWESEPAKLAMTSSSIRCS
jgi:hypothetical protein